MSKADKVYIILESLLEAKAKYIEILKEDEPIYKIKLITDVEDTVEFLDSFFDNGFMVREIPKKEFDDFHGLETLKFGV